MTVLKPIEYVDLNEILQLAVKNLASDIHLSCGGPPRYRIDGDLYVIPGYGAINHEWMNSVLRSIMNPDDFELFEEDLESDFVHPAPGIGRFRVNAFFQQGTPGSIMRLIPTKMPILEQLGMPPIITELSEKPNGLILVTGETGSGKSTTLAAMMNERNETKRDHIITIEDPVEFVHKSKMSLVNHREIGRDTKNWSEALRRVLRQDPDVILIGELRDAETIATAITAAETGHLVFGTLHTQSAAKSVDRIIDSFPPYQQSQIRSQLSETLRAVVSQVLVKKIGGGRAAATEIMVNNGAIANLIREGKLPQVYSAIQTGKNFGMHTLDQDLKRLVGAGIVDKEEVRGLLVDKNFLDSVSVKKDSSWGYNG
jgi:twitching motility protein PilT